MLFRMIDPSSSEEEGDEEQGNHHQTHEPIRSHSHVKQIHSHPTPSQLHTNGASNLEVPGNTSLPR